MLGEAAGDSRPATCSDSRDPGAPNERPRETDKTPVYDNEAGPHFAELFALLARVASARDVESPEITAAVVRGAAAAREAGVRPERVLACLRARAHEAPLANIGEWYRGVLADRLVARAIEAYFADAGGSNPADAADQTATDGRPTR